jgi:hypothetical protein
MTRLAAFVLRHKRLVLLAWLVVAVAGFATISKATTSLSTNFDIPGQAFKTDATIARLYHNGGDHNPPVVLTATLPPGTAAGPGTAPSRRGNEMRYSASRRRHTGTPRHHPREMAGYGRRSAAAT